MSQLRIIKEFKKVLERDAGGILMIYKEVGALPQASLRERDERRSSNDTSTILPYFFYACAALYVLS